MLNGWEILLFVAVFFLLFGAKKLPGLAKALGQSIREFKGGAQNAEATERSGQLRSATVSCGQLRSTAESSRSSEKA
jgi:sec-independent protein translocase protein TatA